MSGEEFLYQAFVYLAAAVVAVPIAKRLGLGSVLGYLVAGVVIGPWGLHLVGEEGQDVMHFAEFGVVMMLFLIGLELQPALLWRMRGPILGTGGLQVGITSLALGGLGIAFGLPWQTAAAVGMALSLSSTAIVLQTLSEKGLLRSDSGQTIFSVLLFQDIIVIPMLALFPLLALQHLEDAAVVDSHAVASHPTWVEGLPAWEQTLVVLAAVGGVVVAGRYLVRPVLRIIAGTRLRELFTAAALLLIVGITLLMKQVGLSPALGAFLAGVVLATSEYRHELEGDIEPFKGLLLGLFFIAVGASMDFQLIGSNPRMIVGVAAVLILVKFLIMFAIGTVRGMGLDQRLMFSVSLAQGGEFAFVLFSFAVQSHVMDTELANPLIASVALTMATTPLLMVLNERLLIPRVGTRESEERAPDEVHETSRVIMAGFGRFGHLVGRFLRANGVKPIVLEHDSDHVEMLRRLGLTVFYGDASRPDLLRAAGAEDAELLLIAVGDVEVTERILEAARTHFPHLQIMSCARGRPEAYELLDHGLDHVYRETVDTSLRMGVDALRCLGYPAYAARRAALRFRRHDEESVRELGRMRHDRKGYITATRERIRSLEELILEELEQEIDAERDGSWDTDSLREELGGESRSR
jgi:monovalent cation:proton antiporter-2 (CPA2) family protein